jgi:non-canonical purine NTP pyrophosphatase (RdgB/HAM1 family)
MAIADSQQPINPKTSVPKTHFVTGNTSKFQEVRAVIPGLVQLPLELSEIQSLDPYAVIKHKLTQASARHPTRLIVEDTSLVFNCLGGQLPGTLIKWFEASLDNAGLADLVSRYTDHTAIARSVIGYSDGQGGTHYFTGQVSGKIVTPRGTVSVFGWNNIFEPTGYTKTFAEMTIAAKNRLSMRGQAARLLAAHLQSLN